MNDLQIPNHEEDYRVVKLNEYGKLTGIPFVLVTPPAGTVTVIMPLVKFIPGVKVTTEPTAVYVPPIGGLKLIVLLFNELWLILWLKVMTTVVLSATPVCWLAGLVESTRGDCCSNDNNDELELLLLLLQEIRMIEAVIIAAADKIDKFFIIDALNCKIVISLTHLFLHEILIRHFSVILSFLVI